VTSPQPSPKERGPKPFNALVGVFTNKLLCPISLFFEVYIKELSVVNQHDAQGHPSRLGEGPGMRSFYALVDACLHLLVFLRPYCCFHQQINT